MSTTLLILRKINAADSHAMTVPEIDRQRKRKDNRCFIFRLRTGFVEGTDGWATAGINPLLILTANTFASVYPTLGLRVFKLSARGNRWSVKISLRIRLSTGNGKQLMHGF